MPISRETLPKVAPYVLSCAIIITLVALVHGETVTRENWIMTDREVGQVKKELDGLYGCVGDLAFTMESLQAAVRNHTSDVSFLQTMVGPMRRQRAAISSLEQSVASHAVEINSLRTTVVKSLSDLQATDASLASRVERDIDTLEGMVMAADGNINTLAARISTVEGDVASQASQSALLALAGRTTTLEGQVASVDSQIRDLEDSTVYISAAPEGQVPQTHFNGSIEASAQVLCDSVSVQGNINFGGSLVGSDFTAGDESTIKINAPAGGVLITGSVTTTATLTSNSQIISTVGPRFGTATNGYTYPSTRGSTGQSLELASGGVLSWVNSNSTADVTALQVTIGSLEKSVANHETEITSLANSFSDLQATDASLTSRVTTADGNINALAARISTVEGDVASQASQSALLALAGRTTTLEGQVASVDSQIRDLEDSTVYISAAPEGQVPQTHFNGSIEASAQVLCDSVSVQGNINFGGSLVGSDFTAGDESTIKINAPAGGVLITGSVTTTATLTSNGQIISTLGPRFGTATNGYTYPSARGSSGQILQLASGGVLSWVNPNSTTDVTALQATVGSLEKSVANHETEITSLANSFSDLQATDASLTSRVTTADGNINALAARISTVEGDVASQASQPDLLALAGRTTTLEGQVASVDSQIRDLEDSTVYISAAPEGQVPLTHFNGSIEASAQVLCDSVSVHGNINFGGSLVGSDFTASPDSTIYINAADGGVLITGSVTTTATLTSNGQIISTLGPRFGTATNGYTYPSARGSSGQILQLASGGVLSWVNPNSTTDVTALQATVGSLEKSVANHETEINSFQTSLAGHSTEIDSMQASVNTLQTNTVNISSVDTTSGVTSFTGDINATGFLRGLTIGVGDVYGSTGYYLPLKNGGPGDAPVVQATGNTLEWRLVPDWTKTRNLSATTDVSTFTGGLNSDTVFVSGEITAKGGINVGDSTSQYALPKNRGGFNQALTSDGTGLTYWQSVPTVSEFSSLQTAINALQTTCFASVSDDGDITVTTSTTQTVQVQNAVDKKREFICTTSNEMTCVGVGPARLTFTPTYSRAIRLQASGVFFSAQKVFLTVGIRQMINGHLPIDLQKFRYELDAGGSGLFYLTHICSTIGYSHYDVIVSSQNGIRGQPTSAGLVLTNFIFEAFAL